MKDSEIRGALKQRLRARYSGGPHTLILDELGLKHGKARVDLIVVNGLIHGFEIKSDRDRLTRLPNQAAIYSSILDRVTLVSAPCHIRKATEMVPEWWGVELVEKKDEVSLEFSTVRSACDNPMPSVLAIAKLLWRDEALALLEQIGGANGLYSKPRAAIYARLAEMADLDLIRARVRHQLKCRTDWRVGESQT